MNMCRKVFTKNCLKWIRNAAAGYPEIYVIEDLNILLASILKPSLRLSSEILKKKMFNFQGNDILMY